MLETIGAGILDINFINTWIAQTSIPTDAATAEGTAALLSGPRFFSTLISGVLLAFGFQLLFTNLSIAAGITYLGHQSSTPTVEDETTHTGSPIRGIGLKVGLWTLITISIALFLACFFAVSLSLRISPLLGAIMGLVIWAAYFSLLTWFSSTAVGSLIGSIMSTATSGLQSMMGTATAMLGSKVAGDRMVATAEAAASAVRREITGGQDLGGLRDTLEDYLETLRPPQLDVKQIRQEFENLLRDPDLHSLGADALQHINRQTFVDLVRDRTDLSPREADQLVDQLYQSWQKFVRQRNPQQANPVADLQNYLATALPEQLKSSTPNSKLDQLLSAIGRPTDSSQPSQGQGGVLDQALQLGLSTLMSTVMGRQDLSDLDVEKVLGRLGSLKDKTVQQTQQMMGQATEQMGEPSASTIRTDVEHYLLTAYSWQMSATTVEHDFREVIYDPNAAPGAVRQQLESLNQGYFEQILRQRGVFTQAKIAEVTQRLEQVRKEVLSQVKAQEQQEQAQDLLNQVKNYLKTAPKQSLTDQTQHNFAAALAETEPGPEVLQIVLPQLKADLLGQSLSQRQDLSLEETTQIVSLLEAERERALQELEVQRASDDSQVKAVQLRLESYLRQTQKAELNPEGIKRDLQALLQDPQTGIAAVRTRLAQVDRDTLVQLLSQRQDLSEEQVNQTIDQVQSTWSNIVSAPQAAVDKTKEQYDKVTTTIADYLRNTQLEELNPEGIQQDLSKLLEDPKVGALMLRSRLSKIDRETLVKLLSQRKDLSEDQVNQTIDQVQHALRQMIKAPRRLASRTQAKVMDFEGSLEDYLRNTQKEELHPDSIKRDLQLLLQHPRAGLENWGDRFSKVDRSTLTALLSQRSDISEEEANRIVDQVLSVRDRFVEQVREIQSRIQSSIERVFERVREYLNSLERPELNYDGIRKDIRQLFSDPQSGFESLRDRLGHFNRDTLVAILSSRDDISEAEVNRVIDQIEGARSSVLQRAERLQQGAQQRLEDLKLQAQRQAEETRKAAETAAWWLFGTALASAIFSALGGLVAVMN